MATKMMFAILLMAYTAVCEVRVVATTGMIGDPVSVIGGADISLVTIVPPGVDPHLYRPTRSDVKAMLEADIVFSNGLLLEGRMEDFLKKLGSKVVSLGDNCCQHARIQVGEGAYDPHLWMDPYLWREVVAEIGQRLCTKLPTVCNTGIQSRADAYLAKLDKQITAWGKLLQSVPQDKRTLVTAHDAFGYFGKRYGFDVLGIQGISTESEASVADIENIVATLVERKIPTVFFESTISERNIKALLEGAASNGHTVTVGGMLYSDALGAGGSGADTYIGMIDHNVKTIVTGLTQGLHK